MILDKNLEFANAVSIAAAAGTAIVGDVIDLDTIGRNIGASQNISFYITVATTFTSGGAAVVQFKLVSDASAALDTAGAATEHFVSNDFAYTALNQGVMIHGRIPGGIPAAERYLGLLAVTSGATTTAGAVSAGLTLDVQDWTTYPDAVN